MKIEFLDSQPENTRLILVFTGWSTGPETGRDISMPGWDVAVAYDFTDLSLDTSFLDRYYTIYLFAWSLGVFAAQRVLPQDRITAAFAVNGTLTPVDDLNGIPLDIFHGTADGLSARNLKKFRMRMSQDKAAYEQLMSGSAEDETEERIENLRYQLRNIAAAADNGCGETRIPWVRAYISKQDRIFPPDNMRRAWEREQDTEIVELDGAHLVDLSMIVRMVIADTSRLSEKFSKASISYDTHAIAQYSAALKLTKMLCDMNPAEESDMLEIGCGTGLFTNEYARYIHPRRATFVDITETGPFDIALETEEYYIEDAERWIERQNKHWDIIVSASAIQWFADIPRFLHRCSERLRCGGIIALSSFLPGNMEELDALRPSPLHYPGVAQLRAWMERDFEEVTVREDEIRVEFRTAREVLMHLKHTGVSGSAPGSRLTMKDMSHLRSLTYRPVYITGRKIKN